MSIIFPRTPLQRLCERRSMSNYWLISMQQSVVSYFYFLIDELSHVKIDIGIRNSLQLNSGNPHTEKTCGFFSPIYSIKNTSIRGEGDNVQGRFVLKTLSSSLFMLGVSKPRTDFLNPSTIYPFAPATPSPGALSCLQQRFLPIISITITVQRPLICEE